MRAAGATAERHISLPADVEWRRMHPVTPLLEGWKVITAVILFATIQNGDDLLEAIHLLREKGISLRHDVVLWALGGVFAVLLLIGVYLALAWRAKAFAIDSDGVYLRTGILFRQLRIARLPRIQAVDVVHPLLGRVLGLGQLTVEVAGGRDSRVVIGYLSSSDLVALRDRILDLAAGARTTPIADVGSSGGLPAVGTVAQGAGPAVGTPTADGAPDGATAVGTPVAGSAGADVLLGLGGAASLPAGRLSAAEEAPLYTVETRTLIGSLVRSGITITALLMVIVVAALAVIIPLALDGGEDYLEYFRGLFGLLVLPFIFVSLAWGRFANGWGFRAAATPAGIRMRFGLTSDTSTTLPPGRVHAVALQQGLMWRGKDWWRVTATVAGREAVDSSSGSSIEGNGANVLLPVGDRDTALRALWLVTPDLGVSDPDALLDAALSGQDDDGVLDTAAPIGSAERGFVRVPRRARIFDWFSWRRQAVALTDTCVILRLGRWHRSVSVIPYERIQSVHVSQGPWARRRGLAQLRLDLVPMGSAVSHVSNLDAADAGALAEVIAQRALRRRHAETLDRWLARALTAASTPPSPSSESSPSLV
ncbi:MULTISPECIES: PH domain-containing protein [Actinomyces]|uniref:PH domain-containing protein n=1 Tax=Actinomyces respiraculi TaxID=2744574 RepID=A0A7T0LK47_9ACTO|nr:MULTISPECIES: PH domain-containing protein [Actinomyces]QPL05112.1 PH domain-containing protein [Actinomyces respiraculi]